MDARPSIPSVNLGFLSQQQDKLPENNGLHRVAWFLRVLLWHYKLDRNIEHVSNQTKTKQLKNSKTKMKAHWVSSIADMREAGISELKEASMEISQCEQQRKNRLGGTERWEPESPVEQEHEIYYSCYWSPGKRGQSVGLKKYLKN